MLRTLRMTGVVVAAVAVAVPAAASPDTWIAHARAIAVVADDDSETITDTGTGVEVGNTFGFGLGAVFKPLPLWGIELDAEWLPLDLTTAGGQFPDLDVGGVDMVSARVSLQYRFATTGTIHPYVGVGVTYSGLTGYTLTDDMRGAGIGDVRFSTSLRVCTQAGADVDIGKGWLVTVDAVYAPTTTRVDFRIPSGDSLDAIALQVNPLLFSIGIGRSF
jgi:outer membrane protein W